MDKVGLVYLVCLVVFPCLFCGDGGVYLGEGGRDVGRGVVEGYAGVADGNAYELDTSQVSSEGAKKTVVLLGLLGEFLLAAEVQAKADLGED